jgi:hypothetical protein
VAGFESLTQQPTKPREVLTMVSGMLSEAAEGDSMANFKEAGFKLISSCRGTWYDGRLQVRVVGGPGMMAGFKLAGFKVVVVVEVGPGMTSSFKSSGFKVALY